MLNEYGQINRYMKPVRLIHFSLALKNLSVIADIITAKVVLYLCLD